jgi:hypothetical protein
LLEQLQMVNDRVAHRRNKSAPPSQAFLRPVQCQG